MNRRELLKSIGISVGGTIISTKVLARLSDNSFEYSIPPNPLHKPIGKPVTAITLGAGNRGTVYGNFSAEFPKELKIVGVAEPIKYRNDKYAKTHKIADENRFTTKSWLIEAFRIGINAIRTLHSMRNSQGN